MFFTVFIVYFNVVRPQRLLGWAVIINIIIVMVICRLRKSEIKTVTENIFTYLPITEEILFCG